MKFLLTFGGLAASLTTLAFWTYYVHKMDENWQKEKPGLTVFSALCPVLVSIYWWENFVPQVYRKHSMLRSNYSMTKVFVIVINHYFIKCYISACLSISCLRRLSSEIHYSDLKPNFWLILNDMKEFILFYTVILFQKCF